MRALHRGRRTRRPRSRCVEDSYVVTSPTNNAEKCYRTAMASPASARERNAPLGGPASVVDTACPLDCPDACSLAVTVRHGKVIEVDGSERNPVTGGFICAKVRKFADRV